MDEKVNQRVVQTNPVTGPRVFVNWVKDQQVARAIREMHEAKLVAVLGFRDRNVGYCDGSSER